MRSKIHTERISDVKNTPKMSYAFKSPAFNYLLEFCIFSKVWIIPLTFFSFNAFRGSHQRKASYNFKALGGQKKRHPKKLQRGDDIICKINVFGKIYIFVDSQGSKFYQPPKKMKFAIFCEALYSIFLCKQKEI